MTESQTSSLQLPIAAAGGRDEAEVPPRRSALLEADDVAVHYGGVVAVGGVSVKAFPGEVLGLIGPNGAGKSSLLGALGGQLKASSGRICFDGHDVTRLPPYRRARLGITRTFQTTSEFEAMTVFENLVTSARGARGASLVQTAWHRRTSKKEEGAAREHAWEVLDRFDMADTANAYGRELSGGQRRLVEIMRCLMRRPSLLLLDEPMVGVAPHLVARLVSDLRAIADEGISLILVEHALEVVQELCDRVVVMAEGKVIAVGSYDEVVSNQGVRDAYIG
jgi:branched-chain amino acid transport system ATP-binding protein